MGAIGLQVARRCWRIAGYTMPRLTGVFWGVFLLTAAELKCKYYPVEQAMSGMTAEAKASSIALVLGEYLLGLWLISGFQPTASRRCSLVVFGGFACVSLAKGLAGENNCACFGEVTVSPWITCAIDVIAFATLHRWKRESKPQVSTAFHIESRRRDYSSFSRRYRSISSQVSIPQISPRQLCGSSGRFAALHRIALLW